MPYLVITEFGFANCANYFCFLMVAFLIVTFTFHPHPWLGIVSDYDVNTGSNKKRKTLVAINYIYISSWIWIPYFESNYEKNGNSFMHIAYYNFLTWTFISMIFFHVLDLVSYLNKQVCKPFLNMEKYISSIQFDAKRF